MPRLPHPDDQPGTTHSLAEIELAWPDADEAERIDAAMLLLDIRDRVMTDPYFRAQLLLFHIGQRIDDPAYRTRLANLLHEEET